MASGAVERGILQPVEINLNQLQFNSVLALIQGNYIENS